MERRLVVDDRETQVDPRTHVARRSKARSRVAIAFAMIAGDSSYFAGKSQLPGGIDHSPPCLSSNLP